MGHMWAGIKLCWRFGNCVMNGVIIFSLLFWMVLWAVSSYQAGRMLAFDDLMPPADRCAGGQQE